MDLVGFVGGAVDNDVVLREFTNVGRQEDEADAREEDSIINNDAKCNLPDTAEHLLLFIFSTWDHKQQVIKRAVARYTVGAKSTGPELSRK